MSKKMNEYEVDQAFMEFVRLFTEEGLVEAQEFASNLWDLGEEDLYHDCAEFVNPAPFEDPYMDHQRTERRALGVY